MVVGFDCCFVFGLVVVGFIVLYLFVVGCFVCVVFVGLVVVCVWLEVLCLVLVDDLLFECVFVGDIFVCCVFVDCVYWFLYDVCGSLFDMVIIYFEIGGFFEVFVRILFVYFNIVCYCL